MNIKTLANVIAQLGRPAMVMAPNKTLVAQRHSGLRFSVAKSLLLAGQTA